VVSIYLKEGCGSGTTLEAAARMGRQAIGLEREEHFVKKAIKWLRVVFD
jgi:DNA modification methylase